MVVHLKGGQTNALLTKIPSPVGAPVVVSWVRRYSPQTLNRKAASPPKVCRKGEDERNSAGHEDKNARMQSESPTPSNRPSDSVKVAMSASPNAIAKKTRVCPSKVAKIMAVNETPIGAPSSERWYAPRALKLCNGDVHPGPLSGWTTWSAARNTSALDTSTGIRCSFRFAIYS